MINVLIVDDSAVAQSLIRHILSSDPDIRVAGIASGGAEAVEAVMQKQPDVITMDIRMPNMDGLEATRQIMETRPTPIVIVSALVDSRSVDITFQAMEAGALAVLSRPDGIGHPNYESSRIELVRAVKLMSEVKVIRRWARLRGTMTTPASARQPAGEASGPTSVINGPIPGPPQAAPGTIRLVAIGASTGGPPVVQRILASLPPDFPVPIVIVQHIAAGFTQGFVDWLAGSSGYPVSVPKDGDRLLAGNAYVAPEGKNLGIEAGNRVTLSTSAQEHGMRPSVSYLFRSVANSMGPNALGVLLTGMGKDGSAELKMMRDKGAATIAQDFDSSIVHGMPGEAIRLGGATYIRSASSIGPMILSLVGG